MRYYIQSYKNINNQSYTLDFLILGDQNDIVFLLPSLWIGISYRQIYDQDPNNYGNIQATIYHNEKTFSLNIQQADVAKTCMMLIFWGFNVININDSNRPLYLQQSQRLINTARQKMNTQQTNANSQTFNQTHNQIPSLLDTQKKQQLKDKAEELIHQITDFLKQTEEKLAQSTIKEFHNIKQKLNHHIIQDEFHHVQTLIKTGIDFITHHKQQQTSGQQAHAIGQESLTMTDQPSVPDDNHSPQTPQSNMLPTTSDNNSLTFSSSDQQNFTTDKSTPSQNNETETQLSQYDEDTTISPQVISSDNSGIATFSPPPQMQTTNVTTISQEQQTQTTNLATQILSDLGSLISRAQSLDQQTQKKLIAIQTNIQRSQNEQNFNDLQPKLEEAFQIMENAELQLINTQRTQEMEQRQSQISQQEHKLNEEQSTTVNISDSSSITPTRQANDAQQGDETKKSLFNNPLRHTIDKTIHRILLLSTMEIALLTFGQLLFKHTIPTHYLLSLVHIGLVGIAYHARRLLKNKSVLIQIIAIPLIIIIVIFIMIQFQNTFVYKA